ncbi:Holliday junction branch migration protein RuvA [Legionella micdadei]|uniref:Holliday junction branch migration complex subunit RuvA n=1 Tax=Legionella micdadei TaxID=451 RepID=A0A098GFA5_LEGMI|nr:Holliday junction branch migration protein RuvA [Legionella micdadei]ARG97738.1 Holliday junction branch migration protein RuvA [Legionella micdadei]ARG99949.1 Holliday junction branch migration protein RuvA [Legionella micdadei]KTD28440.1 Holliday junction DNA helicase RuvA [Legionella micdadei]NSL18788.1 Holliday junction branch migration protein RuvA [Legionella micdadei]CEG60670.1 Holliday junction ATP-dependent DNA helicase ruvA [Legionella micdadei]
MIGWLSGQIVDKNQLGKLVIDVNGVGYDVETSLQTFFQLESHQGKVGLHIHTVVREDALLLYGFLDKLERSLFRSLIKVNGVGPKMAITILSSITPHEFIQCINDQNTSHLTKLPGIGKKTAERLMIEMKDSIKQFGSSDFNQAVTKSAVNVREQDEAISALESLGYKQQEAVKVISKIDDGNKTCEQLIRQALQLLASK